MGGAWLLRADQLGRAAKNPRGCRRLPAAVAARSSRAAAIAGAQPLLQGPRQLDRFPPDPRRLRTGAARPWHDYLQRGTADRPVDRGIDVVFGSTLALCQPARRAARDHGVPVRAFDP